MPHDMTTDDLKAKLNDFAKEVQPSLKDLNVTRITLVIEQPRFNVSIQTGKLPDTAKPAATPATPS